jgi:lipopolysaccharide/colanic/teichoic acid biosynthesis glycosyltransferase
MYEKYFKRLMDFVLSLIALIVLSPVFLILMIIGALAMRGNPFFTQLRPGKIDPKTGQEKIFKLVKFRTMSNKKDSDGNLLPDDVRLNKYGRILRSTSLDELPELWNILKGDMSIVGPRPQLVCDMVFMTSDQRKRHSVRQGLTGLAQVNGRNNMTWEKKFEYDLEYIENITFSTDVKLLFQTVGKVFEREGISAEGMATAENFGDYLLNIGCIDKSYYQEKMWEANRILESVSDR